ncbi:MAG: archaeosine biosynthesis radical SAM protein RaSEA [Archaeoglobaceae archaeon]
MVGSSERGESRFIRIWKEKERLDGEIVDCTTAIITTRGCYWNRCLMCGYARDSREVGEDELISQIDAVFDKASPVVKIFTSGSFFDDREVPERVRAYVRAKAEEVEVKKLIVESRPEFIDEEKLRTFEGFNLEVGIGLESANDFVREKLVNKGFTFNDFARAAEKLKKFGFRVKAYLLLKPPFMAEGEAVEDALESIEKVRGLADVVSLNLTNVQKGTFVERLWQARLYRPPWLWSAVEVLKRSDLEIICDPVAAGKARGPHNCGRCDAKVEREIREFSLTQDASVFKTSCECLEQWEKAIELERFSRTPLF